MIHLSEIKKDVYQAGIPVSILQSLNLHVDKGEFVSIMGPSGSGKSTLLNILGLLDEPTTGEYRFEGTNVLQLSGNRLAAFRNERIGFVFQAFMLIPRLTVEENVEIPLLYAGINRKERRDRIEKALGQVGMLPKAKEPVMKLSGGQKQKVAIARAIIHEPDLLLADEPTGNLDQRSKAEILHIFSELNRQGKTLLLVTHDAEVADVAHRKLTMKNGEWVHSPFRRKAGLFS